MKLVELEDTPWFPKLLRDQQLGFIGWLVQFINLYKPLEVLLPRWIYEAGFNKVHDLCSGSGEPIISLSKKLPNSISISLSDKFPPKKVKRSSNCHYISKSIDVLKIEFGSTEYFTMFNAFHQGSSPYSRSFWSIPLVNLFLRRSSSHFHGKGYYLHMSFQSTSLQLPTTVLYLFLNQRTKINIKPYYLIFLLETTKLISRL